MKITLLADAGPDRRIGRSSDDGRLWWAVKVGLPGMDWALDRPMNAAEAEQFEALAGQPGTVRHEVCPAFPPEGHAG